MNIVELSGMMNDKKVFQSPVFDAVVSNPPYQKDTGSGAVAIYHYIMQTAKKLSKNISMIYPARWTNAGRGEGLEAFRDEELTSNHYCKFVIHSRDSEVFEDATIKGGVNYFLWNFQETDKTKYVYNNIAQTRRTLLNNDPMMIVDPRFSKIVEKVKTQNHMTTSPRNYYGIHLEVDYKIEELAATKSSSDEGTRIFYSGKGGGVRQIVIPKNSGKYSDDGYKAIVSRTADPDRRNNTLRRQNRSFIISPGEIVSGSFLQVQKFDSYEEALFCVKYLRTEFAMFLLGIITSAQSTTRKNYKLIPRINFKTGEIEDKPGKFVDFKNIDTLNQQLFDIYDLTTEERSLILSSVKPWKDDSTMDVENIL